jgi:nucleotide-binding universal stress UspA family protein
MAEANTQPGRFIVVGVDGSEASVEALRWAIDQARATGARLVVIAAWEVPWTIMFSPTSLDEDYARSAKEKFERAVHDGLAGVDDVEVELRMVEWDPSASLVEAAKGADLLVIGSHRYGALHGRHLGSVASYCAHHAPCPVLIHRHA